MAQWTHRGRGRLNGALMAIGILAVGCSKRSAEQTAPAATAPPAPSAPAASASGEAPKVVIHGIRKMLNIDVPVYVDGRQVASMRYGELPSGLPARTDPTDSLHQARYFRVYDYLKALGVPADRVKTVQFMGNRGRIASVAGSELTTQKERFVFDFMEWKTGIARMDWETTNLKDNVRVDEIRNVAVYVDKEVPEVNAKRHCYLDAGGECDESVPYSNGDVAKGTRIYVDNKMVGYVKRRLIADAAIGGDADDPSTKYGLTKLLGTMHVDTTKIKGVDFVWNDDVIAHASQGQWAEKSGSLSFVLQRHSHGKIKVALPGDLQAQEGGVAPKDREAQVTAIMVWNSAAPPNRPLAPIDEELQAALIAGDPQGGLGDGQDKKRD